MDDIAVAADISRRTLFNYFPSKAALVWDGFEPFLAALDVELADLDRSEPVGVALSQCVARALTAMGDLQLARVRLQIIHAHPELRTAGSGGLFAVTDRLHAAILRSRQLRLSELDADVLAGAIAAMTSAALQHWAVHSSDPTPTRTLRRAARRLTSVWSRN